MDGNNNQIQEEEDDEGEEFPEEELKDMVKVQIGKHLLTIDGYLKASFDHVKHDVKRRRFDCFTLVAGREGYGKTTLALQLALYCDPTFTVDRVVFNAEQFIEAVQKATKYQSIVFDETVGSLSSRGSMSKVNMALIKVFSEMRSKHLFVFLCIPNFFIMDWYAANHRSTGLLYVYKRGRFGSYDYPTKHRLWMSGKKTQDYNVSPNFIGQYTKYFPIDEVVYEAKKQQAINDFAIERVDLLRYKRIVDKLVKHIIDHNLIGLPELSDITGIEPVHLAKRIKGKEEEL